MSGERGDVIQVPVHTKDWELFLGTLASLVNGVEQAGEADLRGAVKAALVRQGKLAHLMRGRQPVLDPVDAIERAAGAYGAKAREARLRPDTLESVLYFEGVADGLNKAYRLLKHGVPVDVE